MLEKDRYIITVRSQPPTPRRVSFFFGEVIKKSPDLKLTVKLSSNLRAVVNFAELSPVSSKHSDYRCRISETLSSMIQSISCSL